MQNGECVWETLNGFGLSWGEVMHAVRMARVEALGPASALVGVCLMPMGSSDSPRPPNFVISGHEHGLHERRCGDTPALAGLGSVDLTLVLTWMHELDVTQAVPLVLAQFERDVVTLVLRREVADPAAAALAALLRGAAYFSAKAVACVASLLVSRACQQGRLAADYITVIKALKGVLWGEEVLDGAKLGGSFRQAVVGQLQELFERQLAALATSADMSGMIGIVNCFSHCFADGFSSRVVVAKLAADLLDKWPAPAEPDGDSSQLRKTCTRLTILASLGLLVDRIKLKLRMSEDGIMLLAALQQALMGLAQQVVETPLP